MEKKWNKSGIKVEKKWTKMPDFEIRKAGGSTRRGASSFCLGKLGKREEWRGKSEEGRAEVRPIFVACSGAAVRGAVTEGTHQSLPCVKGGAAHVGRRRDCSPAVGIPERPLIMSC